MSNFFSLKKKNLLELCAGEEDKSHLKGFQKKIYECNCLFTGGDYEK
jgi:NADPH-dependent 7-cyano-7-deazaguanine reductase QueF